MGAKGTQRVDTSERLARLRALMQQQDVNLGAVVVPSEDEHSSEYPSEADKRRAFISGFNGSAGCAVVTLRNAFLFTDGRYFLQAEQQLDENWTLMKQGLPDVPTWQDFLPKNLDQGTRVGIDPTLILATDAQTLTKSLGNSELVPLSQNPVDVVWGSERPQRPKNPVSVLDVKYSGETLRSKLDRARQELAKKNAVALAVTLLDEVAWLFNLRGTDIDFNPVFFAYAVVKQDSAVLFIDKTQVDDAVLTHFDQDVEIRPYGAFLPYLKDLVETGLVKKDKPVLLGDKTSLAVVHALGEENVVSVPSPVAAMKAIKNSTEMEGFRQCHIRDGVALARYFAWLEEQLHNGFVLNESQGADKLEEFRSELDLFRGLSFTTISSAGPNAAIIHYSPDPDNCAIIAKDQIYLCDSGGQYLDGTTDVTRTWASTAIVKFKSDHRVTSLSIPLFFPPGRLFHRIRNRLVGKKGFVARWSGLQVCSSLFMTWIGLIIWTKYRHGTGHGVGHFLNVHEGICRFLGRYTTAKLTACLKGPQGIGTRITYNNTALKPGMTVSNEPGYYADGKWGIRIENVVIVREVKTPNNFGKNGYNGFERVTMCPIQISLIDLSILTAEEKKWLNDYHAEVASKVGPLLEGKDARAQVWLRRQCLAI
ncbi:peptidase M24, structural domain-containing protein [Butyriboletus roseoflavus]|nr:peptidase M24, structural domain-containing protein [Butyriboletus roseoflavus]